MFCDNNIHHGCCHRPFTINIIYLLTVYITDTVKFRTRISVLLLRYKWKFSDFVNINYFECNKTYSHLNKSVMTGEIVLLVTEKIICFLSRVYFNFPPPFLFSDFFDTNSQWCFSDVNMVAEPKPHQTGRKRQNVAKTGNDW